MPTSQAVNAIGSRVFVMALVTAPSRRTFQSGAIRARYTASVSASKAPSQRATPRPRAHMASSHSIRGLGS
eukprot:scaffold21044_cov59-Phaeocystis_antarctica.AAC.3